MSADKDACQSRRDYGRWRGGRGGSLTRRIRIVVPGSLCVTPPRICERPALQRTARSECRSGLSKSRRFVPRSRKTRFVQGVVVLHEPLGVHHSDGLAHGNAPLVQRVQVQPRDPAEDDLVERTALRERPRVADNVVEGAYGLAVYVVPGALVRPTAARKGGVAPRTPEGSL